MRPERRLKTRTFQDGAETQHDRSHQRPQHARPNDEARPLALLGGAKQRLEDSRGEAVVQDAPQDEEDQPPQCPVDDEVRLHGPAVSPGPIEFLCAPLSHGSAVPPLALRYRSRIVRERDYTISHVSLSGSGTWRVSENRSSNGNQINPCPWNARGKSIKRKRTEPVAPSL